MSKDDVCKLCGYDWSAEGDNSQSEIEQLNKDLEECNLYIKSLESNGGELMSIITDLLSADRVVPFLSEVVVSDLRYIMTVWRENKTAHDNGRNSDE